MAQLDTNTDIQTHLSLDPGTRDSHSQQIAKFISTNALSNTSFPHFHWEFMLSVVDEAAFTFRFGTDLFLRALYRCFIDQSPHITAHEMSVRKLSQ